MKNILMLIALFQIVDAASAQKVMTPDLLWQLGRVSGVGVTMDGKSVIYNVKHYNVAENTSSNQLYTIPIAGGSALALENADGLVHDKNILKGTNKTLMHKSVKLNKVLGKDYYPEFEKSEVQIYDDLMYRHWDSWSDGSYQHIFLIDEEAGIEMDIMEGLPHHCPTMPFGGDEDYIWTPDGKGVLYVTKPKVGRDYAVSTNTDIFQFNIDDGSTINLTEGLMGYDNSPAYSKFGSLAWLSMAEDGYEADKNDIMVSNGKSRINLTAQWDGTVNSFRWDESGNRIYFTAPVRGTKQLFSVDYPWNNKSFPEIKQITDGPFDVTGMIGQSTNTLVVSRTDMNHATELYTVDLTSGVMKQLTHVNDKIYGSIELSNIEKRMIKTTDDKNMVTWIIYPPNFDDKKKYPTLLYCQGGPQGALSQFYSFRWNFQIMAAQGYIVVAPNRRGMPGHGVEWNEQISMDYGGQNMRDYLSAIDALTKESFVDRERLGAVGASYGGYSVFYLAGIHNNRFKTFISHDGMFNLRSMYGTTEELFFVNYDLGGPYWEKGNTAAQNTYLNFNPINMVDRWNTPILIFQGGKDYRVPLSQGLEAFQAAQLQGIKSRLIYLPNENHWVLSAQNGLVWQREFFRWLEETL
jgi:dipeptidyl aminopeptidase/acylaminoacyl peptidase